MKYTCLFMILLAFPTFVSSNTVRYVHSAKAKLLKKPSWKSPVLEKLVRGTSLELVEQKGKWSKVKSIDNIGWMSSLLLSPSQPKKKSSLLSGHKKHLDETSRKRASSNSTAAATRGLRQNNKARVNNTIKKDYKELEAVEAIKIETPDAWKFHGEIQ